ncbi:hypothetical protein EV363DRAFT_1346232, partial [Boletus edulis]
MPFGDSLDKRVLFYDVIGRPYNPQADHVACGNAGSNPIVAVSPGLYGSGIRCNQGIIVMNPKTEDAAYARILDECQGCGYFDLNLSNGVFTQIGGTGADTMEIKWYYVDW